MKFLSTINYHAFKKDVDSKMQSLTNTCIFRYCQLNVWQLLPASDYCQGNGNQVIEHNSDNKKVLGSSWKGAGATKNLTKDSEKLICQFSFELSSLIICY